MPCYDHRSSPGYIDEHTIQPLKKRVDQYAVWLCYLLNRMCKADIPELPDDLLQWWGEHQAFDHDRAVQDQEKTDG